MLTHVIVRRPLTSHRRWESGVVDRVFINQFRVVYRIRCDTATATVPAVSGGRFVGGAADDRPLCVPISHADGGLRGGHDGQARAAAAGSLGSTFGRPAGVEDDLVVALVFAQ